ncbi:MULTISPECIES: M55 family metallopeptidase [unclassified Bacillus (in: firmicutes)]|uniref:M55 family metallopeptidase n=1 Tax=unclassified Bacillus (in: firmicutes) TaxID=185979 RepID=UPI0008E7E7D7|nr:MULTISPECIES: M55 family metallopeptidase [unclassified Bacillus (in: firmicutes)]SFA87515.1 D-aminopeptidase DppA. Metallo peptidase. MEROPS family M55 [Bacillus sp. UNCCL13]SFQ84284.1 D-aminopeptidase DppA. Metallo peptidase. MEROPS family M55 [Bacillus sp. cl95]
MKLYMSVDMEGITGLADYTHVDSNQHNYERSRIIMTDEANYVITSAFDEGCKEVVVNDSHSKMNNLLIERLHPETQLITGDVKPFSMVQGLDTSFTGAIFVGYHARASQKGVMSHTMIWGARKMYINDVEVGELGFNAYVAGYYGVPVIMVAGDDKAAQEAEALIPNVTTAIVKETISRSAVKSLTPIKAGQLLREKTALALQNYQNVKPLTPPDHPILRIEFTNYGEAEWANLMPGTEIEEGTTIVRYQAKNILEAYQAMLVMTELAMRTTFC